jgi:hypothetical protein
MAVGLPGAVVDAYNRLPTTLDDAITGANRGFVYWTGPFSGRFTHGQNNSWVFDAYLHLKKWKVRNEEIGILIHAKEGIQRSNQSLILLKSTVHVCYYRVNQNTATPIQSIHFDYNNEEACHPIFHVQLCTDTISPEDAIGLEFPYQWDGTPLVCFGRSRIPTPDMTLTSVLVCLAADHLTDRHADFTKFVDQVRPLQEKMPMPSFDRTKVSIKDNPERLQSSHWFAHMF